MTTVFWIICLIIGAGLLCAFLVKRDANSSLAALTLKTLTSFMFIMVALCGLATHFGEPDQAIFTFVGLFCGLIGDVWLDLKWIYPKDQRYFLYGGFIAFLVGHLFFIYSWMLSGGLKASVLLICAAIGVVVGLLILAGEKILKQDMSGYRAIVCAYTAVITTSVAISAVNAFKSGFEVGKTVAFAGMICFYLSDLILSGTYFGQGKDRKIDIVLNHLFYYVGQYCIASSIFLA